MMEEVQVQLLFETLVFWRPELSVITEAVRSQVTIDDLRRSASLFSLPLVTGQARLGPHRLVEQSFRAILRDLNRAVSIDGREKSEAERRRSSIVT
jgi:hypothetical protein